METKFNWIAKLKAMMLAAFLVNSTQCVFAQLTVNMGANATTLANRIKGTGVAISNAQKKSPPGFTASFDNGSTTNIGINSGIILSTGISAAINGNAANLASTGSGGDGYPLLDPLAGAPTYDAAVLELDMVPDCGTMQIKFVFGSEEYPGYVGSPYNDAFGFFISGPNPDGGVYTEKNIALVPSTDLPISINSINMGIANSGPCVNCSYYVNNTGGNSIKYNGFTVPFTSRVKVVPGATYHLTLAIADGDDDANDASVLVAYEGLDCPAALPVELVSFKATKVSEGNSVEWITTPDPKVDYFVIERSDDGKTFKELSRVYSSGSVNQLPAYQFIDNNLSTDYYTPHWYYRIRVVNKDGVNEYMNQLISVENKSVINTLMNTSVVSSEGELDVRFNAEAEEQVKLLVKDTRGNVMISEDLNASEGSNHIAVNIANCPAGMYIVSLQTSSNTLVSKVLKR